MTSLFKQFIESIAGEKAPGPPATFSVSHIFYALGFIAEKPIGRNQLAKKLDVGEGAVRTIINRLKSAGLIVTSKEGCTLTDKGLSIWNKFEEFFPRRATLEKTELTAAEHNYAFLVKKSGHKVKSGIEQRDVAIRAGALHAVVIVSKGGHLVIESISNSIEKEFPKAARQILKVLQPEENDVIIIAGADSPQKAMHAAFATSWVLLDGDNKK